MQQKFPSNKIIDSFFYFVLSKGHFITCYYYTTVCILPSETELYISIKVSTSPANFTQPTMTSFYVTDDGFESLLQIRHFSNSFSFVSLHLLPVLVITSRTFLCQSLCMGTPCYILSAFVGSRPVEGG